MKSGILLLLIVVARQADQALETDVRALEVVIKSLGAPLRRLGEEKINLDHRADTRPDPCHQGVTALIANAMAGDLRVVLAATQVAVPEAEAVEDALHLPQRTASAITEPVTVARDRNPSAARRTVANH